MPERGATESSPTGTKLRNVRNVPPGLKAALIADATKQGRSVADTALCVLAEFFNTDCPESGNQPRSEPTLGDQLQLRMPEDHSLWGAFWAAAKKWQTTESSAIIKVLSDHYGQSYVLVRRGRKPKVVH